MAIRIKIETPENNHIHFAYRNDYTLCSLESSGHERIGIKKGIVVDVKVNCPTCIEIVQFCHSIKTNEFTIK